MTTLKCLCALWLLVVGLGSASAGSLLLKNAIVHTISGRTLSPGQVLIEEGKIKTVAESIEAQADEAIDLEGKHLFPGLIAATSTVGLIEIEAVRATRDFNEVGEYTPDVRSWLAVNPDSELIPVARLNGLTHALPVPMGGIIAGMSGLIALQGWTAEEMAIRKPVALHLFWPSHDLDTTPRDRLPERERDKWKSLEDQAKDRRARLKQIDDFFSEAEAYWKSRKAGKLDELGRVPAWEATGPFIAGEVPLMIHADEFRQIKAALEWAHDRKFKIILAGGRDAWKLAEEIAAAKVPVIYERVFNMGNGLRATPALDVESYDIHFKAPSILQKAGVKLAISEGLGGDSASNARNLPYSAAHAMAFGLPEEEALKAITLHPAEILGVADRLGSIEPGKEASLFVADRSILDARAKVTHLWIAGNRVPVESRHTRLYDKYKSRPR